MIEGHTIPCLAPGFVRLIDHMGTDQRIVEAARLSYKSPSKGDESDKKLIAYLYKNRHTSPFEQCNITYNIKLPLFVQGQLVRHRTQRLNQLSTRYTEMTDEFYFPDVYRVQDTKNKQGSLVADMSADWHVDQNRLMQDTCNASYKAYLTLLESGVAKEMARMILPVNLYTEIYSNWDLHNLMHMFTLRLDHHAQLEIRVIAQAMFDIFEELYPWTAEAYKKYKFVVQELSN